MTDSYDKSKIKEQLNIDNIYELLEMFGGEPEYTSFGIISATICHNPPGVGSKKLYYYSNSSLFYCYTGCEEPSFDIFQLVTKVMLIQKGLNYSLNDSVRYVAYHFGITSGVTLEIEGIKDWGILRDYDRIQKLEAKDYSVKLKEYDPIILDRLNYEVKIYPWLKEGITQEVMDRARIGFYPGGSQISIPHYDKDGRFIGLRGRTLGDEEATLYGKYRPIVANGVLYTHPLGLNLYNLNNSKNNIKNMGKAFVYEGEKSCLLHQSLFGIENDTSVASCGSNLSIQQMNLLIECGAQEIIIAFDRQFQEAGDEEFKIWTKKLEKINDKYKNYVKISIMFDKENYLGYKESPIEQGTETFITLYNNRIFL